jgi:RHS repeat-associated protein
VVPGGQAGLPALTLETPQASTWFTASSNRIAGWNYDAAGNVAQVGSMSRSFTYDVENRQVTATINGNAAAYTYDGDGRRVTKTSGGLTTVYVYDAGGELAAEYGSADSNGTVSVTTDALGSTRLTTNGSGALVENHDYLPFGQDLWAGTAGRDSTFPPVPAVATELKPGFTSKERDAETGLDYFGARYMSSAQGRFTSPDPSRLSAFIDNPQTWNMYSYAYNNPLRFVDKNGMWPTGIHNDIIDAAFPNLSPAQRQILKDVSAHQDGIPSGGQSGPLSYEHAMRGPGQSVGEAEADFNDFVSMNEDQAMKTQVSFWLSGKTGFSEKALAEFAAALHAIEDSTSPAHAGFQLWEWYNPKLVWQHHWAENTITPQQFQNSVNAAQQAFRNTFTTPSWQSFLTFGFQAAPQPQPKEQVTSCITFEDGTKSCQ